MIYTVYNFFNKAKEPYIYIYIYIYIWNKIKELRAIFKENHVLIKGDNPSELFIVEEELGGIDRDDIENLEDLLRLVLISDECGYPNVVVDDGELTINIG